ncbi:MAG TPA: carboxypeptidase regulatory-like domain-containing protein [Tepidisphaeraceae bacterium]|nr:carboxypeptidase regulatory-like domain-containing protein [Tepidisphaeraceae bacterium]
MHFNRHRSKQSSRNAVGPAHAQKGHRRGLIETLESRQLLSAAGSSATPAPVHPTVVQSAETVVTGSVSGRITGANGSPLMDAHVVVSSSTSTSGPAATTDANGRYTVTGVPVGTRVVHATATGYRPGASAAFTVAAGSDAAPTVKMTVVVGATVGGAVTDANGNPLSGAVVHLVPSTAGANAVGEAITNASGQYTFQGVAIGSYVVRATDTGYEGAASGVFTVVAGNNSAPTLKLTQIVAASLTGRVTDAGGNPIVGASVLVAPSPSATAGASFTATTNASGQYTIPSLPVGNYTVRAEAAGYVASTSAPFTVGAGSNTAPTLVLTMAVSVTGTVTDANGVVLAGVSVALLSSAAGSTSVLQYATTSATGQYTFPNVAAGSYVVRGSKDGYMMATSAPFAAAPGSNTAPTLKLTQIVTGSVSGLITDTSGNPIANATVALTLSVSPNTSSSLTATTDSSGHYTLATVPAGTYVVRAQATGYTAASSASFTVAQGSNTAPTVQLAQRTTLTGTVTTGGGTPLAGAKVSIFSASSPGTTPLATFTTTSIGQYSTDSLPPGSYIVMATAAGYNSATSAAFTVIAGANVAPTLALTVSVTPPKT